jgi:hypothetical protein
VQFLDTFITALNLEVPTHGTPRSFATMLVHAKETV